MYPKEPTKNIAKPPHVHHMGKDEIRMEHNEGILFIFLNMKQIYPPEIEYLPAKDIGPGEMVLQTGMSYSPDPPAMTVGDVLPITSKEVSIIPQ